MEKYFPCKTFSCKGICFSCIFRCLAEMLKTFSETTKWINTMFWVENDFVFVTFSYFSKYLCICICIYFCKCISLLAVADPHVDKGGPWPPQNFWNFLGYMYNFQILKIFWHWPLQNFQNSLGYMHNFQNFWTILKLALPNFNIWT